jgi:hypothetical protein
MPTIMQQHGLLGRLRLQTAALALARSQHDYTLGKNLPLLY